MSPTRTHITTGPNGVHLTVRSVKVPRVCAQRAKLPSVAEAHRLEPVLQEHVGQMLFVLAWRNRERSS